MEFFAWVSKSFDRWWAYLSFCLEAPYTAHVCKPMWKNVAIASIVFAVLLIGWVVWKYIDYRLKYAAAIRAELERERWAEPEVMERARWTGDDPARHPEFEVMSDEALAGEIRAALARRKLGIEQTTVNPVEKPAV